MTHLLGMVLVLVEYAKQVHQRIGFDGPLQIVGALDRIRGVPLYGFIHDLPKRFAESRFDDAVTLSIDLTTERLSRERDVVAMELMQSILFALGWSGPRRPEEMQAGMETLIRGAYEYNYWPYSTS